MPSANTYKAMIATTLLSSAVVFLGFVLHIKKKSELIAETFYELESESLEEEEKEDLDDILKSLDDLLNTSTNKAFNENEEFKDEAFEERLEEIRNRNDTETLTENSETTITSSTAAKISENNETNAFSEINDIIAKTSEKKRMPSSNDGNKNSAISYSLVNRSKIEIPPPIYLCENGGKIVVNITVDSQGNVINANFNSASTTDDGCLIDHALEYAKASKFSANANKSSQIGTITFLFKRKS